MIKAWHFTGETLRDGRPIPPDGEWLEHDGELEMCASGLHASRRIIDALKYSPGNTICRVTCDGEILEASDKLVCTRRRIDWRIDGEEVLRDYARWCAWQVVDSWGAPGVVRRYLSSGDEDMRRDARVAALEAVRVAQDAARAAQAAAWAAAPGEAWLKARAARATACDAACNADWETTRYTAQRAAWNAKNAILPAWVEAAHRGEYRKWRKGVTK